MAETKMTARKRINRRMAYLSSRWDLNDFPDDQEPKDASEANVAYCELLSLLRSLPAEK